MQKNWLSKEAEKADCSKDIVVLENPETKKFLDNILLKKFWPVIFSCLEQSGYNYSPEPQIDSELSCVLERSLSFMLFDGVRAFFRGKLNCSKKSWMLESEFFLPLPMHNDPQAIFAILGNSRLKGNPPTLIVDKEGADNFYQIDFRNGSGAGWGLHGEEHVEAQLKKAIDVNIAMYHFSKKGISLENIGEFLSIAYDVYESF
ncbi:MAG: hypothetical protein WC628_01425 [Candidatus Omnitrophota bacterium]